MTIETKIAKNGSVIVSINGKNIAAAKAAQKALAAVDRRYNSILEIVNHNGDKYQVNTWEVNIISRDHDKAVKEICSIIRDFAHGKIKSNVEQPANIEEETKMTKSDKTAAIEAEIKSIIAERTDAYDELEAAKAEPDIVTYRDGKLDWVSSPKYGASFKPSTGQYVVRHFECGKTSGKVVHTDYTSDPEKFFAEMEKRGACSFNEPAQMTDATFEQLLDSRKPIDVVIREDPQTREEYYAAEGQRLSEEQFAAAMIHDEYVELLGSVEFYREHHGLTLAQAEQIYIYNLDEDNIVDGHVDQMIARFKAENNPDPDDEQPTPDTKADYAKLEELFGEDDPPKSETNALVMLFVTQIEGDIAIYRRRKSIAEALAIANAARKIFGDRLKGQVLKVNPDNHNDSEIVAVIERGDISDEELLPDETRPATDNPAVVDKNVRDVKLELDEANGIFRENFDGLRNEILAAFDGNADSQKYVLDVTAEMDELRDNIRKLEAALYHARRGEQFTIPNWRKIPADDCDEAEPVTEETILAVNETIAAINDAAPDGWEIFYDCDKSNFAIDYRDKPVTNIDSLALARVLPADKFFARFLPLVDDRAHEDLQLNNLAAEVDSLQEMRGELQHDPERLAIIDKLISAAKSEAGRILAS